MIDGMQSNFLSRFKVQKKLWQDNGMKQQSDVNPHQESEGLP
jgi:hypothetical protein